MTLKPIAPDVFAIPLGIVNAFIITGEALTVIDTGMSGSAARILSAVQDLGKKPQDVRHILVTHCHADHSGGLAALKNATGATAYMHATDAALVRTGNSMRPAQPAPGIVFRLMYRLFMSNPDVPRTVNPAEIEQELNDGDELPFAGGLQAIHAPGHTAGQMVFLWPHRGGVLFAADTASNMLGLTYTPIYEDLEQGHRTLRKISALDFEIACFGHGRAITAGAAARFGKRWGKPERS